MYHLLGQITGGVFNGDQFHILISFIIEKLKQFGPPVSDKAVDNWYEQYLSGITDITSYSELLPPFFNEVLRRLDQIEESIKYLEELHHPLCKRDT